MRLRERLASLAESNPYLWLVAWRSLHWFPVLLPHDPSYRAVRHFFDAAPGGLLLDIGANDGISVLSFRALDSRYRILSFEPNLLMEPSLARLKRRDDHFDYRMVGAGAKRTRERFFVPYYRGILLHTFTSSSSEQARTALAASFGQHVADAARFVGFENEVVPLDELKLEPTIAKIDAEGFEHEILLGMADTIDRCQPFIVVEIAWDDEDRSVQMFLESRDYVLLDYDLASGRFLPSAMQAGAAQSGHRNSFAVPRQKLCSIPVA
jgi:FkbM family methyltransferase